MLPQILLIAGIFLSAALAAPQLSGSDTTAESAVAPTSDESTVPMTSVEPTTAAISATLTFSITATIVTTIPAATSTDSTSSSSYSRPTYTATEVYAFKPGSPIHLLPFQAKGQIFRLNDSPGIYCPSFVEKQGGCSMETNITGINGCALVSSVHVVQQQACRLTGC